MVKKQQEIHVVQNKVCRPYGTYTIGTRIFCIMSTIALCLTGCAGEGDAAVGAREDEAAISAEVGEDVQVGEDVPAGGDVLTDRDVQASEDMPADGGALTNIDKLTQMSEDSGVKDIAEDDDASTQKNSEDSEASENLAKEDENATTMSKYASQYASRLSENNLPALEDLYSYELPY